MKLTMKRKLRAGFVGAALLTAVVGFLGYWELSKEVKAFSGLLEEDIFYMNSVNEIKIRMLQHRRNEKDFFLNIGSPDKQKSYLEEFTKNWPALGDRLKAIDALTQADPDLSRELKQKTNKLASLWEKYCQGFLQVAERVKTDPGITPQNANLLIDPSKQHFHEMESLIAEMSLAGSEMVAHVAGKAKNDGTTMKNIMLAIALGGIAMVLIIGFVITGSLNRIIAQIAEILSESSHRVASASGQVSSASQELAEGTSQQAASVEETSSSLEEMASMTHQNADHADQANGLMRQANDVVEKASQSMTALTTSMEEITRASEQTSKIIKTIDEIAFQTNLLALNAAVEAARAGEAGAGFAVVADEVRNLAMRAAEAARNTADLIEGTIKKVNYGAGLVAQSGQIFSEVTTTVTKVGGLVEEIAAASREQSQGVDQLNKAMTEIDKATQRNAANAEESAASAEEMNAQAEQIKDLARELAALVGQDEKTEQKVAEAKAQGRRKPVAFNISRPKSAARALAPSPQRGNSLEVRPEQVLPLNDEDF